MELLKKIDEFNRKADEIAYLHWLEGVEVGPDGLIYVDTPWAVGVVDAGGALIDL